MNTIKLAALNLLRNKRRSLLSLLIIAIAILALMVAGGFGLYTYQSLEESAARDSGHLTLSQVGYFSSEEDHPLQNGLDNYQEINKKLLGLNQVKTALPRINFSGLISNGEKTAIFTGLGILAEEFRVKGPFLSIEQGASLLSQEQFKEEPYQIMLGKDLAKNLKLKIGDSLTLLSTTSHGNLNAIDFTLVGVFSSGVPDLDKRQIYVPLNTAQELLNSDKVSSISIFSYQIEDTLALQQQIQTLLPELELTPWWEQAFFYEKVKNLYNRIFFVMGFSLALLISVALYNTLTMSVSERTREIGTLKALGCTHLELRMNYLWEALLLALLGCLIGLLLAGIISFSCLFLDLQMPPPPGRSNSYPLYIYFSWPLALMCSLGVSLICMLTSLLALKKVLKLNITEALIHV